MASDSFEDLLRRVCKLEQKVEELQQMEEGGANRGEERGKKLRRRFSEMQRNFQVQLA